MVVSRGIAGLTSSPPLPRSAGEGEGVGVGVGAIIPRACALG